MSQRLGFFANVAIHIRVVACFSRFGECRLHVLLTTLARVGMADCLLVFSQCRARVGEGRLAAEPRRLRIQYPGVRLCLQVRFSHRPNTCGTVSGACQTYWRHAAEMRYTALALRCTRHRGPNGTVPGKGGSADRIQRPSCLRPIYIQR